MASSKEYLEYVLEQLSEAEGPREEPYPGGKAMLLVTEMENKSLLRELLEAVAGEV